MLKRFLWGLSILGFSLSIYASPTVKFVTPSLGFSNNAPFTVGIQFSQPVTGFTAADIHVTNATIVGFSGGECVANYTAQLMPTIKNGLIQLSIPANVALSTVDNSPNLASNVLNLKVLDPQLPPSSNFDLSRFQLILPLPLGGAGNAIDIENSQLNAGYTNPPYFYTDPLTGSMNFFAPLNGATTPGTAYPRSELAEEERLQWTLFSFADNTLTASVLIKQIPDTSRITIGQIHDRGNTDPFGNSVANKPLLKLIYDAQATYNNQHCGGCVRAEIRRTPATPEHSQTEIIIATDIPLNTIFTYVMDLKKDGTLTMKAANKTQTIKLSTSTNNTIGWGSQYFLFHAGSYLFDNGSSSTEGGQVNFYYFNVIHKNIN